MLRKPLLDLIFFLQLRFLRIFEKEAHIFILCWALWMMWLVLSRQDNLDLTVFYSWLVSNCLLGIQRSLLCLRIWQTIQSGMRRLGIPSLRCGHRMWESACSWGCADTGSAPESAWPLYLAPRSSHPSPTLHCTCSTSTIHCTLPLPLSLEWVPLQSLKFHQPGQVACRNLHYWLFLRFFFSESLLYFFSLCWGRNMFPLSLQDWPCWQVNALLCKHNLI